MISLNTMIQNTNNSYQQLHWILKKIAKVIANLIRLQNENNGENNLGGNQNRVGNPLIVDQNQNINKLLQNNRQNN